MCREKIQSAVLASYADELERSKMPGYVSRYDDLDGGEFDVPFGAPVPEPAAAGGEPPLRRGPLRGHTQHSPGGHPRPARLAPQGRLARRRRLRPPRDRLATASAAASEPSPDLRSPRLRRQSLPTAVADHLSRGSRDERRIVRHARRQMPRVRADRRRDLPQEHRAEAGRRTARRSAS